MMRDIAEQIGRRILEAIYPIRVIDANNDRVTLNEGGRGIVVGQIYDVFALGEEKLDPYTGEKLGQQEIPVAKIKIASTTAKMSTGAVVETTANIPTNSICRLAKNQNFEKAREPAKDGKKISTEDLF
jgi:hypothetical protein